MKNFVRDSEARQLIDFINYCVKPLNRNAESLISSQAFEYFELLKTYYVLIFSIYIIVYLLVIVFFRVLVYKKVREE